MHNDRLSSPLFCSIDENHVIYRHKCLFYLVLKSGKPRIKGATFGKGLLQASSLKRDEWGEWGGDGRGKQTSGKELHASFYYKLAPTIIG